MSSINVIGSSLDVASIVDGFIYVEAAPVRNMQSQVSTLQTKVSALQALNTRLSSLSSKVNNFLFGTAEAPMMKPYSFYERLDESAFSKCKVTSSAEGIISATASNATGTGSYSVSVSSLAQAQSSASSGFADKSSTVVGTGTLRITKGNGDPVTVTINSTNNTLTGVCNAINDANAGVTATIINDGSSAPFKLLLTATDTGTSNAFTIAENLSGGQALGITQMQAATDAHFSVNEIEITKSSNTVSDVISGVTFTLKDETTAPVTLNLERDIESILSSFKEIISGYNEINSYVNSQYAFNTTTKKAGILSGDSTLRNIQSKLQSDFAQPISNRFTDYRVASQVGLNFNRDGSLSLDESKLRAALSENYTAVAALFLGDGTPSGGATASDSRVLYSGKTASTQPGTYNVQISALAEQASATGSQAISALSGNETLTITSAAGSAVVSLLENDSLATVLSKINTALSGQGIAVTATDDGTGRIRIATDGYGSAQNLTIVSDGDGSEGTTGFSTTPVSDTGADLAGMINGHAATGSGLVLTGAEGQPEEGLSLNIAQTSTGNYGTVTIAPEGKGSDGISLLLNLQTRLDGITDPLSGPIHHSTDSLNQNIRSINDQITKYEERLEVRRRMLTEQFNRADQALRLLSVTQSSLGSQISSLSK